MNLYDQTIEKLNNSKGSFPTIAKDTGLDYDWLCQVASQRIKDPGIKKIERLYRYLTEQESTDAA